MLCNKAKFILISKINIFVFSAFVGIANAKTKDIPAKAQYKCLNTLFDVVWCQVEKPDTTGIVSAVVGVLAQ